MPKAQPSWALLEMVTSALMRQTNNINREDGMIYYNRTRARKMKAIVEIFEMVAKTYKVESGMAKLVRVGLMKMNLDELLGLRIMLMTSRAKEYVENNL